MKEYKATAVISLHAGKVMLSKEQASPRMHALDVVDKKNDVYSIKSTIQFKAGEVFSYDGDIPKMLSDKVGDPNEEDAAPSEGVVFDRAMLDEKYPGLVAEIKAEGVAEELREQDIMEAISMLEPGNAEHFTEAGLPQVKAIEDLLNDDISASERDAAFSRLQQTEQSEDE